MRVFVAGREGQLARALLRRLDGHAVTALEPPELDLGDRASIRAAMEAAAPDLVVNAAAFTVAVTCVDDGFACPGVRCMFGPCQECGLRTLLRDASLVIDPYYGVLDLGMTAGFDVLRLMLVSGDAAYAEYEDGKRVGGWLELRALHRSDVVRMRGHKGQPRRGAATAGKAAAPTSARGLTHPP